MHIASNFYGVADAPLEKVFLGNLTLANAQISLSRLEAIAREASRYVLSTENE